MIDFHTHILPLMDDGSKSIEESIKMLKMLSAQGVKRIVATPHFYANDESVDKFLERREKSYKSLTEKLSVDLPEIILGAEVRYYNGISRMENLDKLFIGKNRLLLLEMPFSRWTEHSVEEIIQLSNLGDVTVVLAHFDRYLFMQSKQIQEKIFNSDILLQCNSECFESWFSRLKAFKLLNNDKILLYWL